MSLLELAQYGAMPYVGWHPESGYSERPQEVVFDFELSAACFSTALVVAVSA